MVLSERRGAFKGLTKNVGKACSFMHPNLWTLLGFLFALVCLMALLGGYLAWAFVFMALAGFMDFVDGAVAKYAGEQTKFGALFDHSVDKYIEGLLIFGIGIYVDKILIMAVALFGSVLVGTIDAKAGEVWGKRRGYKLFGRAERMLILIFFMFMAVFIGNAMLILGLIFVAFTSHLTAIFLLYSYAVESIREKER
jgi:phosphatidylglycerophosphate synthase